MTRTDISRIGIDKSKPDWAFYRGLDLLKPTELRPEETAYWRAYYLERFGRPHKGLDFWLDNAYPEPLKRYSVYAGVGLPVSFGGRPDGSAYLLLYALLGYDEGVRYLVHGYNHGGLRKSQVLERLAIVFLHCGPRGMETIAEALEGYEWVEPAKPTVFSSPYLPDPAAFQSGLDFTTPTMSDAEKVTLAAWYVKWEGEIPPYVQFMLDYQADLLKGYRARFENIIHELPKQWLPMILIHMNLMNGWKQGIRENVLLARGFGVPKADLLSSIAIFVYGVEALSLFQEAAGDVIASWERDGFS